MHTTPEALSAMQASHYDLVVTDLLMPGGGGWEVLKLAATMDGAPRVLVLSGLVGAQVEEDAMAMGASGFLRKPVSRADLSTKVGELLA